MASGWNTDIIPKANSENPMPPEASSNRASNLLVSVVIPAFNAETLIERALGSVQGQDEQDFEIIVVDDCSADNTVAVVKAAALRDPRIRLIRLPTNQGPSEARNVGFAEAKGEWIFILDADDAYRHDRISTMLTIALEHDLDMICDNIMLHDYLAGRDVRPAELPFAEKFRRIDLSYFLENSLYLPRIFSISRNQITQFALFKFCFRRSFVEHSGVKYEKEYRDNEDFIFYSECLIAHARAAIYNAPMYIYTQGFGEISRQKSTARRTPRDRSLVVKAVTELVERRRSMLSETELGLLDRRARQALAMQAFEYAMDRQGLQRLSGAVAAIASRPLAFQFFMNLALTVLGRKLRRLGR
jgi:succinoglycan biosynthesis protein ExoO